MGAYLSHPVTDKHSSDERNDRLKCGASSMQGWRVSQEDAHNCILNFSETASLFAVYDGHGGKEVAEYTAETLPGVILETKGYQAKEYGKALKEAFLAYDESLTQSDVLVKLKAIATSSSSNAETVDEGENIGSLREEAAMPLEQLIARYRRDRVVENETVVKPSGEAVSSSSGGSSAASCSSESPKKQRKSLAEKYGNGEVSEDVGKKEEDGNGQVSSSVDNGPAGASEPSICSSSKPEKKIIIPDDDDDSSDSDENFPEVASSTSGEKEEEEEEDEDDEDDDDDEGPGGDGVYDEDEDEDEFSMKMTDELLAAIKRGKSLKVDDDKEKDLDEEKEAKEDDDDEEEEDEEEIGRRFLIDALSPKRPGSDSGCTAVVALVLPDRVLVANAGDSRCVACKGGKAVDLSVDHKPEDPIEYARITKAGGKVSADGRVNGGLNLSRALGDHVYKQVAGLSLEEQMISPMPDIHEIDITDDVEFIILACDGVWNSMSSQEVVDFVRKRLEKNPKVLSSICEELFENCLAPNTNGCGDGCDNMTAVIVQFRPPPEDESCSKRAADSAPDDTDQPSKKSKTEDKNFPTTAP